MESLDHNYYFDQILEEPVQTVGILTNEDEFWVLSSSCMITRTCFYNQIHYSPRAELKILHWLAHSGFPASPPSIFYPSIQNSPQTNVRFLSYQLIKISRRLIKISCLILQGFPLGNLQFPAG